MQIGSDQIKRPVKNAPVFFRQTLACGYYSRFSPAADKISRFTPRIG